MLDSDDVIQKDYLQLMHQVTEDKQIDVVICDINNVSEENIFQETERIGKIESKTGKEFFQDFILHKITIGPFSLMINREFLKEINLQFNEDSRYSEEFIFITDLLYNANKVIHVKEKLYNYCLRKGSVSTDTNIGKIVNGYNQIKLYSEKYKNENNSYASMYNKYALPRWILATARFTASNFEYQTYRKLMKQLNAKSMVKQLFTFHEWKIKLASISFCISMPIFYQISRKN